MFKCVVLFLLFSLSFAEHRKISLSINPGCSGCHDDKNVLVHVTADGPEDTLHHIWDFTYKPTVMLSLTPLNTSLSINWPEFRKGEVGAVKFSSPPKYVFSFVINQIIEFNDRNNTATYEPSKFNKSDVVIYNTHHFDWKMDPSKLENSTDLGSVVIEGKQHHGHHKTQGSVMLTLSAFGTLDHSRIQPHLLHTVNASQIEIVLDGLTTNENFKSRFALGLTLASTDLPDSNINLIERKSLNDEHSPGVFKIGEVKTNSGYLMWRSVAYLSSAKPMTDSTEVHPGLYLLPDNSSFHHTVISSLLGNETDSLLTRNSIYSFGQPGGNDFYSASPYLSWTFIGGLGHTADDSYSLFMELLTILGIGLPALLVVLGLGCIIVKRISKQSHDIVFAES